MKLGIDEVRKILNKLPEGQRKSIENIISGEVIDQVICGECGRVIAEVYKDGRIEPKLDGKGKMWLLATRNRLDGYLGFQCLCGNDSRLSEQEKGVKGIELNRVTKKDIEKVLGRVSSKPSEYIMENGEQNIDNFIIKKL